VPLQVLQRDGDEGARLHRQKEVDPVPVLHLAVRRRPAALHPLAAEQERPPRRAGLSAPWRSRSPSGP
jgi:hypothetical protein